MAFQSNDMFTESYVAGVDLPAGGNQFRFVKLNATGKVIRCGTLKEKAIGVLLNHPNNNEVAQVVKGPGGSLVVAGAAISIGQEVSTDAQGRAVPATTNKDYVNGIAKEAATNAGDVISVDLITYQKNV